MGSALRQSIATELRAQLARQRKTGVDLAAVLQCSQQAASRRLTGEVSLDLDDAVQIADWLGIDVADLLPRRSRQVPA